MRILVIEDEPDLADAIARGLRRAGYAVDEAGTVVEAEMRLASAGYDLVLADWMLPDGAGIDVCRRLRSGELDTLEGRRPKVLMVTARDEIVDRVEGLDAGADDYLVKPFAFAELQARVRALLRRDVESYDETLAVGDIVVDPVRFKASRDGHDLGLTAKEFSVLQYFLTRPDEVLSQETLLEHCWDEAADPFTNTVRVTLSNLRRKLGDPPVIETIPNRGYVLRSPSPPGS